MKPNNIRFSCFLTFLLFISSFISCEEKERSYDAVFITGTEVTPVIKFSVEKAPASIPLSVSCSDRVSENVKINFKTAPDLVAFYNEENDTGYKMLPKESFTISSNSTVIKPGNYISEPVSVQINSLDDIKEGDTYLLPVSISDVKGGNFPVLESSRTAYILINRTVITSVASLTSNFFFVKDFSGNSALKALPEVSYEARILVNNFQFYSPYISTVMGIEAVFLIRFGDLNVDPSQLQFLSYDNSLVSSVKKFATNRWYHIAVVYNGSNVKIYIDGKLETSKDFDLGPMNLAHSRGFYIGASLGGRYLDGLISECRVWTKALTPSEIASNMCYVDPKSPGLLAYWRFNEGEGNVAEDHTGHGHTATGARSVEWEKGIRCP